MAPVMFFTAKAPPKLPLVISYRIREAENGSRNLNVNDKTNFFDKDENNGSI